MVWVKYFYVSVILCPLRGKNRKRRKNCEQVRHPHEETLSILRDAGVDVYRTDLLGTITVSSDGQNYTVATEHFATDAELNPTDPAASSTAQQAYIGNVNSKKFHLPSCPNLPAEKNQILFSSYDEAVAAGYSPCSSCIK